MSEAVKFLTPVGRLVQGHPMEANPVVDDRTKQPKLKRDGTPQVSYFIALAFAKSDPAFMSEVWPLMTQVAQRDWPQGQFNAPTFSWKLIDGDGIDREGKPYASREGFAGHWILKINSGYSYQVVDQTGKNSITDPKAIKRGDYLRAYVGVRGNAPSQTPGLYVNPDFVQLCGYGQAITSGPDASAILGQAKPFALPAGASAMPIAQTPMPAVGAPGMPMAQPGYQQPMAAPPPQPGALPTYSGPQPYGPVGNAPAPAPVQPTPTAPVQPAAYGQPASMPSPGAPTAYPSSAGYQPQPGMLQPPGGVR